MASPQRENGHIDIANEIAEAMARYRISGTEWQVLWVILRYTWGWHKKDEFISYGVIAKKTGLTRRDVIRKVQSLADKKILVKNGEKTINNLKFNKDYEQWEGGGKITTTAGGKNATITGGENTTIAGGKKDTTSGGKNDTSPIYVLKKQKETIKETEEEKKDIKEKKIRFLDFIMLTETEHKKLVEKFGEDKTNEMIEHLNYYIGSKGKHYKSHYYTILQWLASDKKRIAEKQGGSDGNRFRDIKKVRATDFM